jgi:hypothetical protein
MNKFVRVGGVRVRVCVCMVSQFVIHVRANSLFMLIALLWLGLLLRFWVIIFSNLVQHCGFYFVSVEYRYIILNWPQPLPSISQLPCHTQIDVLHRAISREQLHAFWFCLYVLQQHVYKCLSAVCWCLNPGY